LAAPAAFGEATTAANVFKFDNEENSHENDDPL